MVCFIACQEKYEKEQNSLQQMIEELEHQCFKLAGRRAGPIGEGR